MTRAVERALGVGTVGVCMTAVFVVHMFRSEFLGIAFVDVYNEQDKCDQMRRFGSSIKLQTVCMFFTIAVCEK